VFTLGVITAMDSFGDTSTTSRKLPTRVRTINNAVDVACGQQHIVVLEADGTVSAAGRNNYGQLGDNTVTTRKIMTKMLNVAGDDIAQGIVKIACRKCTYSSFR